MKGGGGQARRLTGAAKAEPVLRRKGNQYACGSDHDAAHGSTPRQPAALDWMAAPLPIKRREQEQSHALLLTRARFITGERLAFSLTFDWAGTRAPICF